MGQEGVETWERESKERERYGRNREESERRRESDEKRRRIREIWTKRQVLSRVTANQLHKDQVFISAMHHEIGLGRQGDFTKG